MGKLIVIEGLDGSGKATQTKLLNEKLQSMGISSRAISFPNYNDPSSTLVQMYLKGEFGDDLGVVNAYAASSFYACDRIACYLRHWKRGYEQGETIIADRYTTSNAIHQMVKLPTEKWDEYIAWLEYYEYDLLSLPRPDIVIYLDVSLDMSIELLSKRYKGDEKKKDIHEKSINYLMLCDACAHFIKDDLGWKTINCAPKGHLRTPDDINSELLDIIRKLGLI